MADEKNKYPVKITHQGVLLWGLLIFIAMVWMFVVGIVVGRGMAPVTGGQPALQQELKILKKKKLEEDRTKIEKGTHLPFYEELKKSVPEVIYKTNPPEPDERDAVAPPQAATPVQESPSPTPSRSNVDKPSDHSTPASATAAATPPNSGDSQDRFTVQVGAFRDLESAQRMVKSLKSRGYQAYHVRMGTSGKGVWFKVRVGVFKDRSGAETLLKKMNKQGLKGLVVKT